MIADPHKAVQLNWITMSAESKIQQCGIDVTLKRIQKIDQFGNEDFLTAPFQLDGNSAYDFVCNEYVSVPNDCCALLIVRSSLNRKGAFITTGALS